MKFLFDVFPVILFFVAYKLDNIYFATGVAIAASIIQIIYLLLRRKKIEYQMWITLAVIVIFGGFTIWFHDDWFIKWKPSILYWIFALVIFIAALFYKKNIIKLMLKKQVDLPEKIWNRLNAGWGVFFFILGFINIYVAYKYSTNTWVDFKLFGVIGLIFIFVIIQSIYMMPYMDKEKLLEKKNKKS